MIFFLNEWSDDCFQMYKAILLIPDVFNHKHTKLLANLLLERLGFGSAILHQVCTSVTLYQRFFVPSFNSCACLMLIMGSQQEQWLALVKQFLYLFIFAPLLTHVMK